MFARTVLSIVRARSGEGHLPFASQGYSISVLPLFFFLLVLVSLVVFYGIVKSFTLRELGTATASLINLGTLADNRRRLCKQSKAEFLAADNCRSAGIGGCAHLATIAEFRETCLALREQLVIERHHFDAILRDIDGKNREERQQYASEIWYIAHSSVLEREQLVQVVSRGARA